VYPLYSQLSGEEFCVITKIRNVTDAAVHLDMWILLAGSDPENRQQIQKS